MNFNPLSSEMIENIFLTQFTKIKENKKKFVEIEKFNGCGVYFIFQNDQLVYIGKAMSKGGRKGIDIDLKIGTPLFSRLKEHKSSIEKAINLDINEFYYSVLVLDVPWVVYAEHLFIKNLQPIWNRDYDGFGNHFVGTTRKNQKISKWDQAFPGRLSL